MSIPELHLQLQCADTAEKIVFGIKEITTEKCGHAFCRIPKSVPVTSHKVCLPVPEDGTIAPRSWTEEFRSTNIESLDYPNILKYLVVLQRFTSTLSIDARYVRRFWESSLCRVVVCLCKCPNSSWSRKGSLPYHESQFERQLGEEVESGSIQLLLRIWKFIL